MGAFKHSAPQKRGVGIATGMQNLHDDFAAFGMHGLGDHTVV